MTVVSFLFEYFRWWVQKLFSNSLTIVTETFMLLFPLVLSLECAILTSASGRIQDWTTINCFKFSGSSFQPASGAAAPWGGGAVHLEPDDKDPSKGWDATISGCQFIGCRNGDSVASENQIGGGAVYSHFVNVKCESCYFEACEAASGKGGAISADTSVIELTGCDFKECKSNAATNSGGGAVYSRGRKATFVECDFSKCITSGDGGAVLADSEVGCTDCNFTATVAGGSGGVMWVDGEGRVQCDGCILRECYSTSGVDCLYLRTSGLVLSSVKVFATADGGNTLIQVAYHDDGDVYEIALSDCHINGNRRTFPSQNRAIMFPEQYGDITVNGSSFSNWTRESTGGAFLFRESGLKPRVRFYYCDFTDITVTGNSQYGGAINFADGNDCEATVTGCLFQHCMAPTESNGGAVFCKYDPSEKGTCLFENCTFKANSAGPVNNKNLFTAGQSLAIEFKNVNTNSFDFSKYVVRNCTFEGHDGRYGYPLFIGRETRKPIPYNWTLEDLTFTENARPDNAHEKVRGIIAVLSESVTFVDCQFIGCSSEDGLISATYTLNDQTIQYSSMVMTGCTFTNCKVAQELLFFPDGWRIPYLMLQDCRFSECTSKSSSCVMNIQDGVGQEVVLSDCTLTNLQGTESYAAIFVNCSRLTVREVQFHLSLGSTSQGAIGFDLVERGECLLFENCMFSNGGQEIGSRYIEIADAHQYVRFVECSFEDISTSRGGAGLRLSLSTAGSLLC